MTRFSRVRDLLEQVQGFHGELASYYGQVASGTAQERVKMLLEYLSSHQRNLERSLKDYADDASRKVLETWVDESHCARLLANARTMKLPPDMNVEDVARLAMQIDECLVRIYRYLSEEAETAAVREVFRNLVLLEQNELRKLALNALRAGDM
jgi:hypothetical protein